MTNKETIISYFTYGEREKKPPETEKAAVSFSPFPTHTHTHKQAHIHRFAHAHAVRTLPACRDGRNPHTHAHTHSLRAHVWRWHFSNFDNVFPAFFFPLRVYESFCFSSRKIEHQNEKSARRGTERERESLCALRWLLRIMLEIDLIRLLSVEA